MVSHSDLVGIINNVSIKPLQSFGGIIPVKRVPNTNLAVKYTTNPSYGNHGEDMLRKHLRAYILDIFFRRSDKYTQMHVMPAYDFFEINSNGNIYSGYTYFFKEGIVEFDTKHDDVKRNIAEWQQFQNAMKEAGFDFSSRNSDKGAWAGGASYYENIVYSGDRLDEKFTNEWVAIDFCSNDIRFDKSQFTQFIDENRADIIEKISNLRFQLLLNPSKYHIG